MFGCHHYIAEAVSGLFTNVRPGFVAANTKSYQENMSKAECYFPKRNYQL
jgi:hypothetical protein